MNLNWLLLFIPIAIGLDLTAADPVFVFLTAALAIVPLAKLMGDATESLAHYLGATFGGLLNATLGNAPEIIISLFALHKGLVDIVKASITGSIIGNLLFGLGIAMFVGGLKRPREAQKFHPSMARMNSDLLLLAVFGLIVPAVFAHSTQSAAEISLPIAMVLIGIYVASFLFTVVNIVPKLERDKQADIERALKAEGSPFAAESAGDDSSDEALWSRGKALAVLAIVTIALAVMSEILTGALEPATESLGLTPLFAGVFLLALVGNAAELFSAARFARNDQMDLSVGITVGASLQVALLVVPLLVFAGILFGQDMDLVFTQFELVAIVLSVMVSRTLVYDGESNWLEGLALIAVYVMLGVGFYYAPSGVS